MDFGLAGEQKAPGFSAALASDLTAHRTGLSAADLEGVTCRFVQNCTLSHPGMRSMAHGLAVRSDRKLSAAALLIG
jgi:hypothetical protein